MTILSTSIRNDSNLRPAGFYIVSFSSLKFIDLYLIFLAVLYIVTVLSNSILIFIIVTDHRLHTPKYLAVANLAIVDLIFSTAFVPESSSLSVLAYDSLTGMSYGCILTSVFRMKSVESRHKALVTCSEHLVLTLSSAPNADKGRVLHSD
ncbi:olfactory receptor 7A42-like [Conger conger]|uniref:olfactory receptor 7A42-like n=1 Tax=Conger conger TaxID=82655 RepID=UPI002A59FC57|nr:olfactory receptor 7A42-like [Conger conger]